MKILSQYNKAKHLKTVCKKGKENISYMHGDVKIVQKTNKF